MSDAIATTIDAMLAATETEADRWALARLEGIGASEVACLFNADPYHSRYELWARKRGLMPPSTGDDHHRRLGHKLEPVIASEYEELTRRPLVNLGRYHVQRMKGHGLVSATLDRVIMTNPEGILEIKATHAFRGDEWKDGPPLRVQLQLQQQMAVTGATWGSVAVLPYPQPVKWWDLERDQELIDILVDAIEGFWRDHVLTGAPPTTDHHRATRAALHLVHARQTEGLVVRLPREAGEMAGALDLARTFKRTAQRGEAAAANWLDAALGEAEMGLLPDGRVVRRRVVEVDAHERAASERRSIVIEDGDQAARRQLRARR